MPRTPRVLIEKSCYHVISRGNQKQIVFFEDEDYMQYLGLLRRYKLKYPTKIYAYCLMNNHVHLMLDPSQKDFLTKVMHGLNLCYSRWFNEKYEKCGHLWQDRYKSYVIQKEDYLLDCLNYIEHNPVRSKITLHANEYPWSSYPSRILGERDKLTDTIRV
ncbi:transposase [Candidatus Omnitrophota bacterium]